MPEISVVIPTKDRLRYLQRAVPIFLKYDQVREVIIVIDGCQDGTLAYAQAAAARDQRVRYTDNAVNRGVSYSRNRGIALAESEYIFSAEDDLELSGDFFGMLLSHMRESGADIIAGRNIFRFETESMAEAIRRTDGITGDAVDRRAILVHTGIAADGDQEQLLLPSPMLFRAEIFGKIKFDDAYLVNAWREESDFQLTARTLGYKLVFCPHAISFNTMIDQDRGGVHAPGKIRRVIWVVRNNWHFIRKHRTLIDREFDAGNHYAYIARFTVKRVIEEIVVPLLIDGKRRLLTMTRGV